MKRTSFKLFCFFLLGILGTTTYSCKKELSEVGNDLQPPGELLEVEFQNSNLIQAFATKANPGPTRTISAIALGSFTDPIFGPSSSGLSINFTQPTNNISFKDDPIVDSLVLSLQYLRNTKDSTAGYYGDTNSMISYKIYRLNEEINTIALSDETPNLASAELLVDNFSFKPSPIDSVVIKNATIVENINVAPQIRIPLPQSLGNEIIAYTQQLDEDGKEKDNNDDAFKKFLKGIYIEVKGIDSGIGVFPIFNIGGNNSYSKLELFYTKSNNSGERIHSSYSFTTSKNSSRTASYYHNPEASTDPIFKQQVIDQNTVAGNERFFVQGLDGVESIIKFPQIKKWAEDIENSNGGNKKIAINKAELILPVQATSFSADYRTVNTLGMRFNLPKDIFQILPGSSADNFGGGFIKDDNEYRFLISRYIQGIINGNTTVIEGTTYSWDEIGVRLFSTSNATQPNRVVINGVEAADGENTAKMRLLITYTIINN